MLPPQPPIIHLLPQLALSSTEAVPAGGVTLKSLREQADPTRLGMHCSTSSLLSQYQHFCIVYHKHILLITNSSTVHHMAKPSNLHSSYLITLNLLPKHSCVHIYIYIYTHIYILYIYQ